MTNNELIDELYKKYFRYLLYIAKRTISETDAEDIVHDVFLKLMESPYWLTQCLSKSNNPNELKRILQTFLHNALINHYKHSNIKHKIFYDTSDDESFEMSIDVEQKYNNKDLLKYITNIINRLKSRGKDIIIKYYIEGYSISELAKQTGLAPCTIKTYRHRMLEYLRKTLREYIFHFLCILFTCLVVYINVG
jgi:RNA polymerase sigma factor (sigma-70 family)